MTQHFSATIVGGWKPLCICFRHILQAAIMKFSENINWTHIRSCNESNRLGEAEENELQAVDLEYGGEDVDFSEGINTERELKKMQKKQEIQNRYAPLMQEVLTKAKRLEDHYNKMKTIAETTLQEIEAEEGTVDDYRDKIDMGYFNS